MYNLSRFKDRQSGLCRCIIMSVHREKGKMMNLNKDTFIQVVINKF